MKHGRLLGIQFARGFAALLVVVCHACHMMALPQYAGHLGLGGFFRFGYAGVDFFFVLSGFIIYFVHHADLGRPERLMRYCWRRVTRIYPNYWLILAVVVAMTIAKSDPINAQHFFRSVFLLPDTSDPMLGVAWTLVHEMMFYAVFALGIINLRLGIVAGALWVALIATSSFGLNAPFFRVAGASLNLQFLMGMAVAQLVLSKELPFARLLAVAGLVGFLVAGMAENANLIPWASVESHMLFAVCSAVIIAGIAAAERQGQLKVGRIGEFFGGASYLLYLVHTVVIGLTLRALMVAGLVQRLPDGVIVLTCVVFSVAVAGCLYRFFDLPIQAMLGRFGRTRVFTTAPM